MTVLPRPVARPDNPNFSSGPCAKRPGWSLAALSDATLARSHRGKAAKAKLKAVIDRSKALLGMPADWRLGIVPASDTGAVEMALWNFLGSRPVDVLAFESFSEAWAKRRGQAAQACRCARAEGGLWETARPVPGEPGA